MNHSRSDGWIRPLLGRADDMRAEVWLRCDSPGAADDPGNSGLSLSGTLTGPECSTAATLPTTVTLVDLGHVAGQPPLARGVCTEPGFWTPELPNLYRAEVVLRRGDAVVSSGRRMVGLRRLGVRGRSLWLDGRRFVPRGVALGAGRGALETLRTLAASGIIDDTGETSPLDETMSQADRIGVAMIIRLDAAMTGVAAIDRLVERIDGLASHPSAVLAILPETVGGDETAAVTATIGRRRGTMLLGLEVDGTHPPRRPPAGLDCVVVSIPPGGIPHEGWQRLPDVPLLASTVAGHPMPASAARAECDRLQARLAAWARPESRESPWDWAGYLIR